MERGSSYYTRTHAFGPTPGHPNGADLPYPALAAGASVARCFRCHSTGPLRLGEGAKVAPAENGIGCEACHGPGARHIATGGDPQAIGNPGRLNAVELNQFCGTCHRRPPDPDDATADRIAVAFKFDWSNPWNVRHQPAYLSRSSCFRASRGALSCITCHDPHSAASLPLAEYDRRCIACHSGVKHNAAATGPCASCHMPAIAATPEMQFADHWIGVYGGPAATVPSDATRAVAPLSLPATTEGKRLPPNDPSTLIPLFNQALDVSRKQFGVRSAEAARNLWLLGSFLAALGTPAEAEQPLRDALAIDRANRSPLAPADAFGLGQVLLAVGRRKEAIAFFEEAARGDDRHISAQSYTSLARLDLPNAATDYSKAVAAEEAASGSASPRVAVLLSNLALALRARGNLAQAETVLRRALRIQEETLGRPHLQSAVSMNNLGTVLQSLGKLQEAEALERDSIAIFERKLPCSFELAAAYANLGSLLAATDRRANAAALLRQAIATDQSAGGSGTLEEAADLASLARVVQERDPSGARTLLKQSLSIYEARTGAASQQVRDVRKALAQLEDAAKP